ncbi:MAG: hypothetical protein SGPRY_005681, partial [Prymnesium sp.]
MEAWLLLPHEKVSKRMERLGSQELRPNVGDVMLSVDVHKHDVTLFDLLLERTALPLSCHSWHAMGEEPASGAAVQLDLWDELIDAWDLRRSIGHAGPTRYGGIRGWSALSCAISAGQRMGEQVSAGAGTSLGDGPTATPRILPLSPMASPGGRVGMTMTGAGA